MTQKPEMAHCLESEDEDNIENMLSQLTAVMRRQQDTLNELTKGVDQLKERIAKLESRPKTTDQKKSTDQKSAQWPTVDWHELSRAEQGDMLTELADFADELVWRYGLQDTLRPCWWRHDVAREELTSLWAARKVAYAADADQSMPSWWTDLLERSQVRLRRIFVKCRKKHQDPETDTWMPDEERSALDQKIKQLRSGGSSHPVNVNTAG